MNRIFVNITTLFLKVGGRIQNAWMWSERMMLEAAFFLPGVIRKIISQILSLREGLGNGHGGFETE